MGKEAIINSGNRTAEFFVLEEIRPDREYFDWASGTMKTRKSTTSQNYFVDHLADLSGEFTVNLYINSMGGSVKEALGIHSVLQRCPAKVIAYIDGFAASAASVIAMAAEKVIMPRNTAMMIHNAAMYAYGNPAELRKAADDLDVINRAVIQSYSMHAGDKLPADKLQEMLDSETWLTAKDAVAKGLIDKISENQNNIQLAASLAYLMPKDVYNKIKSMIDSEENNPEESEKAKAKLNFLKLTL